MKKLILILTTIALVSCSMNDDAGDVISHEFESIKATLPQGEWKVSTMIDGTTDITAEFESFTFTFNQDGTVVAKNDLLSEQGTWRYSTTASTGEELVFIFDDMNPFKKLNEAWDIISVRSSVIELRNIGANNNVELLTFTKL